MKNAVRFFLWMSAVIITTCNSCTNNLPVSAESKNASAKTKNLNLLTVKGDGENGKRLFKMNCRPCHDLSDKKIVGPGLKDVFNRVPQPPGEWLQKYIANNLKVEACGDDYAIALKIEYNGSPMTVFEDLLSEQEINDIICFMYDDKRSD